MKLFYKSIGYTVNTHTRTHLLYVQTGDIQMDYTPLQVVHHTITMVMSQQVPHQRCGEVTKTVRHNVRLQRLQENTLSNCVL